jgi:hypothetical protein
LLDVAVRKARRVGRGGDLIRFKYSFIRNARSPLATVTTDRFFRNPVFHVLIPVLADIFRVSDGLKELDSGLHKVLRDERKDQETYMVKPELLPLDLQMVLKEAIEAATTAGLYVKEYEGQRHLIGSLFVTCNPRATKVKVFVKWLPKDTTYFISYSCKSHVYNDLELTIDFEVDETWLGKFATIGTQWLRLR